jgi:glycosyltransferase involved in cell wall biosynthesis
MKSKPRILFLCGSTPPTRCGVGDYTHTLARMLSRYEGLAVGVLTSGVVPRASETFASGEVDILSPFPTWSLRYLLRAQRVIERWSPDVIHVQWPAQGYDGLLAGVIPFWFRHIRHGSVVATLHEHLPLVSRYSATTSLIAFATQAVISVRPDFQSGYASGQSFLVSRKPFFFIPNASQLPRVATTAENIAVVRQCYGIEPSRRIVAYFGLIYPDRDVDKVFAIADPSRDHLLIVGDSTPSSSQYLDHVARLANTPPWRGHATMTGFLNPQEAAQVLAVAEAVVLPFRKGGGIWNTSIHAARTQGTFVLATSKTDRGYDAGRNIYWAPPGDYKQMSDALACHIGTRPLTNPIDVPEWVEIAASHRRVYESL